MNNRSIHHMITACMVILLLATLPLNALATAEEDANKAMTIRWIEEFMLTGNTEAAVEMTSADFMAHSLAGYSFDLDTLKIHQDILRAGIVDLTFEVDTILAMDNLVAVQWTERGTILGQDGQLSAADWHTATTGILRFEYGRVAEMWFSLG